MQTFLPYQSFTKSLYTLDDKREGKQRLEGLGAIYICDRLNGVDNRKLYGISDKWAEYLWKRFRNHPVPRMWREHVDALKQYYNFSIIEWVSRGFSNSMRVVSVPIILHYPPWLTESFCSSHRSNLLCKDNGTLTHTRKPYSYKSLGWTEPDDLPYIWPV